MFREVVASARWLPCVANFGRCGRVRETLRALVCDDDRGGTLPGGMLYILVMLSGLADLMPLLSMLVLLSGSLFSALRVSVLGRRLDVVSARLGSVSSRMSDRGRIFKGMLRYAVGWVRRSHEVHGGGSR